MVISASSFYDYDQLLGKPAQKPRPDDTSMLGTDAAQAARLDLGKPDMYSVNLSSRFGTTSSFAAPASLADRDASNHRPGNVLPDGFDFTEVEEVAEISGPAAQQAQSPGESPRESPREIPRESPRESPRGSPRESPRENPQREENPLPSPPAQSLIENTPFFPPTLPRAPSPLLVPHDLEPDYQEAEVEPLARSPAPPAKPLSPPLARRAAMSNAYEPPLRSQDYSVLLDEIPQQNYEDRPKHDDQRNEFDFEDEDELVNDMVIGELKPTKDGVYADDTIGLSSSDSDSMSELDSKAEEDLDFDLEFDLDAPRTTRNRVPTLATWRGERINYVFDERTGTRTVESIHLVDEVPDVRPDRKRRRTQPVTVDSRRADQVAASLFNEETQAYSQQVLARPLEGNIPLREIEENAGVYMNLITSPTAPVVISLLKFQRTGAIERRNSGQLWYTFVVFTGKLMVRAEAKEVELQREGTATVPAGNYFSIHNVGTSEAKVLMVQAKSEQEAQEMSRSIDVSAQFSDI